MALLRILITWATVVACSAFFPTGCGDGGDGADSGADSAPDTDTDGDTDADAGQDGGPGSEAIDISAGVFHTCAVIDGGYVKCWGSGQFGELGYGYDLEDYPEADSSMPSTLPFVNVGAPVARIEAAYYYTCALLASRDVLCWGFNSVGQLGQSVGYSTGVTDVPADYEPISLGGPVAQLSTGVGHACALLEGGVLRCWGDNSVGELGDGNGGPDHYSYAPVVAEVGGNAAQVSAGGGHTCAVLENGDVYCWGDAQYGALGYGDHEDVGDDEVPADVGPVDLGGPVTQVSCGGYHTCALLESGEVICWGLGDNGVLGYGNTDTIGDDEVPSSVGTVDVGGTVVQVSSGTFNTCALLEGGGVKCWGSGGSVPLGYGNTESVGMTNVPADVGTIDLGGSAVLIDNGYTHICVLLETGEILCWGTEGEKLGYGDSGDIGDDETPAEMGDVSLF